MVSLNDVHIYNGKYFKECCVCGFYFQTKKSHLVRRKTCSTACSGHRKKEVYLGERNPNFGNRGSNNSLFKGGVYTHLGYRLILKREYTNSDESGYVLEHRYLMEQHLGRPLRDDEIVHHKDHNKLNNDISNLEIMDLATHSRYHANYSPQPRCSKTGEFISKGDL